MEMTVKICGLSTVEALETARDHGATHLGFIFFEKSPRNVTAEKARDLATHSGDAKTVAVTVDADDATLDHIVATMRPDMLQLHGAESVERCYAIESRFGLPIIKALAVEENDTLETVSRYDGEVDFLLLDGKPPSGSDLPGGNGVSFDWSLLLGLGPHTPMWLSGGIGLHNLAEALQMLPRVNAKGIDLSSGVERAPGVKDTAKIAAVLKMCREHQTQTV